MIVLAIHSTTPSLGAAVVRNGRTACERSLPPGRKHVENIAGLIEDVTICAQCRLNEVDAFAVTTGPGSFSGIRVGLATIKGVALALRRPVIGISCLEVLAWESLADGESGVPIIDARRGEVYTALYRKRGARVALIDGPFLMKTDQLQAFTRGIAGRIVISGDRLADYLEGCRPNTVRSRVETVSASACALMGHIRAEAGETDGLHGLAPLYIRRSDAEENKKDRTQCSV